jgi:hypothetical protein
MKLLGRIRQWRKPQYFAIERLHEDDLITMIEPSKIQRIFEKLGYPVRRQVRKIKS